MKTLKEHKARILQAIAQNGPYSHNIVSLVLRGVSADHGTIAANELVRKYNLTDLYGIPEVEEKNENNAN